MVNNFNFGERIFVLFRYLSVARTVVVFRCNFLTFWRVEIFQVGFRHLFGVFFSTTLSTDTAGWLCEDRLTRRDDFEFIFPQFIRCQQSFIFPRQSVHRQFRALDKVLVDPRAPESRTSTFLYSARNKILCFCLIVVVVMQRVAPGCQVIPARHQSFSD